MEERNAAYGKGPRDQVTTAGCLVFGFMVSVLVVGSAAETLAPESRFSQFVSTDAGKCVFIVTLIVVTVVITAVLSSAGIESWRSKDD